MNIQILHGIEGAKQAKGCTVIIDVFRAFTVEPYIIHNNAKELYALSDKNIAYAYQKAHPDTVLIGERGGVKLPGFDFGNSPSSIEHVDFTGKTILHTTSAGTQGIANATGANEILAGSFVMAKAIAKYIQKTQPTHVSLVAMGLDGTKNTDEDELCAKYLKSLIEGKELNIATQLQDLAKTDGAKFFQPELQEIFPQADFNMCITCNQFPFVLKMRQEGDLYHVTREDVNCG